MLLLLLRLLCRGNRAAILIQAGLLSSGRCRLRRSRRRRRHRRRPKLTAKGTTTRRCNRRSAKLNAAELPSRGHKVLPGLRLHRGLLSTSGWRERLLLLRRMLRRGVLGRLLLRRKGRHPGWCSRRGPQCASVCVLIHLYTFRKQTFKNRE